MASKSGFKRGSEQAASGRLIWLWVAGLVVSLVLAFASLYHSTRWDGFNEQYLRLTADQQALARQIPATLLSAAAGNEDDFETLRRQSDEFQRTLETLKRGLPGQGLPPSPPEVAGPLRETESAWLALREGMDRVQAAQPDILAVRRSVESTGGPLPELAKSADRAAELLVERSAPPGRVLAAARLGTTAKSMETSVQQFLASGLAAPSAVDRFTEERVSFAAALKSLQGEGAIATGASGAGIQAALAETASLFQTVQSSGAEVQRLVPAILPAMQAAKGIGAAGRALDGSIAKLSDAYRQSPGGLRIGPLTVGPATALILAGLAALFLILLGGQLLAEARRREADSQAHNDANQQAILRLLDEMGNLADGDLTVEATVTEDVTGAIADSINYAIDALRGLVTTINATSKQVTESAQATRSTTVELAKASESQAREIARATGSIKAMTGAIDAMARDAKESAEVASRSVKVASRGAETVRATIQGMDQIREHIQETAKRIKRLGESSQEIGDIVELIDDIADQTNILALNAAMQAAMAGEAGRGFAVVADEVQRLAERSSNATKQIEALVRTIQADTNEAVNAMEASTAGVVEGAKLAENAGAALQETENVSNYIAELTQRIAESAQRQSGEAEGIDATVSRVQDITQRNTEGTRQTAKSVEALAELAVELQRSVAGFRLP
jgi:twitching motility protein PilJ